MVEEIDGALRCNLLNDADYACSECRYDIDGICCDTPRLYADVKALCEALEQRIPRWISVEERLPEDNVPVLVWELQGFAYVDVYKDGAWEVGTPNLAKFTHWMPIPEPPKEVSE